MDKRIATLGSGQADPRYNYKRIIVALTNRLGSEDRTAVLNAIRMTNFDNPKGRMIDPFQGISKLFTDAEFNTNLDGLLLNIQNMLADPSKRITDPNVIAAADSITAVNSGALSGDAKGTGLLDPNKGKKKDGGNNPVILPDKASIPTLIAIIQNLPESDDKSVALSYIPVLKQMEKDIDSILDYLVAHPNELKRLLLLYDVMSTALATASVSVDGSLMRSLADIKYKDLSLKTKVNDPNDNVLKNVNREIVKGIATGDIYVDVTNSQSPFVGNAAVISAIVDGLCNILTAKTATGQTMIEGFFEAIGLLDSAADRQAQANWVKLKADEAKWMHETVEGSIYQEWAARYLSDYLNATMPKNLLYPLNKGLWEAFKDKNPGEVEVIDMWQRAMLADIITNKENAAGVENITNPKVMRSSTEGPQAVFNYIVKFVPSRKYKDGSTMPDDNLLRILSAGSDWRVGMKWSDGWDNTYAHFKKSKARPIGTQWQSSVDAISTEAQNFARFMTQFKGLTYAQVKSELLNNEPMKVWDKDWFDKFKLQLQQKYGSTYVNPNPPVVVDPVTPPNEPVVVPDVPTIIPGPVVPYNPGTNPNSPSIIVTPGHVIFGAGDKNDLSDLFMLGKALEDAKLSAKMIYPALEGDSDDYSPLEGSVILAGLATKALATVGKAALKKIAEKRAASGKSPLGGIVGKVIDKIKANKQKNIIANNPTQTENLQTVVNSSGATGLVKDVTSVNIDESFSRLMEAFDKNNAKHEVIDGHVMQVIEDLKVMAVALKGLDSKVDMLLNSLLATTMTKIPFYQPVSQLINNGLQNPVVTVGDIADAVDERVVEVRRDKKYINDAGKLDMLRFLLAVKKDGLFALKRVSLSEPMKRIIARSIMDGMSQGPIEAQASQSSEITEE